MEYEEARVFSIDDLLWLPDFHPAYQSCFKEHMLALLAET
ncbi:MAG: hypothetical protein RL538_668 [Candidatus Parcubacteria bacterium]|jgi:hypothetical protein